MRTRLLLVLAVLGAVAVTAFAVPLAVSTAEARTRDFVLGRDADLQRFTMLADSYVTTGKPGLLFEEMDAYHELYGEALAVVSTRGTAPYTAGTRLDNPQVAEAVSRALRNERSSAVSILAPWSRDTVVFAKPIGTGAQVNGAAVIAASTESARRDVGMRWLLIGLGVVAALAGFGLLAAAVSGWVLRPLERLSGRILRLTGSLPFRDQYDDGGSAEDAEATGGGPPELREVSRSFDVMSSAVLRSAEAQRRLVADTAHQLRNPLAALQLRLDSLAPQVQDGGRTSYGKAMAEADRLKDILDDLLALSSAETPRPGKGGPDQPCVPYLVSADRVDFWHETAAAAGVTLRLADTGRQLTADVDRGDLEQILDVLLDNACKYAGPGATAEVRVGQDTAASWTDRTVSVTVADNGPGVPAADLGRLTERFYRGPEGSTDSGPHAQGSGLGLAIVEALVKANGGSLSLAGSGGGGLAVTATFRCLPETGGAGRSG